MGIPDCQGRVHNHKGWQSECVYFGDYGFISSTKQQRWVYIGNCVNIRIFSDFNNLG